MVSLFRKGTIWYSVPYVGVFLDSDLSVPVWKGYLDYGDRIDGDNAIRNLQLSGIIIDNPRIDDLPPAVSSGYVVNGTWKNHFNLFERDFGPNYSSLRVRMWPGEFVMYDTEQSTYEPPIYPKLGETDYDVQYIVKGKVSDYKYGYKWIPYAHKITRDSMGLIVEDEDLGICVFPTIGVKTDHVDADYSIAQGYWTQWISALVKQDIANTDHTLLGLHDTLIREAVDSLAALHSNNIENVKQIIDSIIALRRWSLSDIAKVKPKSLIKKGASLWMRYRYEYTTTKLDIDEFIKQVPRMLSDDTMIGRSKKQVRNVVFAAKLHVRDAYRETILQRLYTFLDQWGLAPTWVNFWDLMPLTFVFDWFVDFADFAHEVHTQKRLEKQFDIVSLTFGRKYLGSITKRNVRIRYKYYDREVTRECHLDRDIAWYRDDKTKNKVWVYRLIDGVSMLIS